MSKSALFEPFALGPHILQNRIVMAPMTRNRAGDSRVPNDLMSLYYEQRASAGLIITEGVQISQQGVGYPATPGIHTSEQVEGWKTVVERVHKHNGKIFLQLWHVGRISHPDFHGGELPVAPSAIRPQGQSYTPDGLKDYVTPHELTVTEINGVLNDYQKAAANAKEAGFDGVEVHAANGYLINQFLTNGSNQRKDEYGGSTENRSRFLFQVIDKVLSVWPGSQVGVRLSPSGIFNDIYDSSPKELYTYVIRRLNDYNLGYLHLIEPMMPLDEEKHRHFPEDVLGYFGDLYDGTIITNGSYTRESGLDVIENNRAELVSYGKLFLANPDLPERFSLNAPLNQPDADTFYAGEEKGYIDYPCLGECVELVS